MGKDYYGHGFSDEVLCAEYEAVCRYVLSLCHDKTEAQDIAQETFMRAMKAREKYAGNSSLYTWLCAIAKNIWYTRCRKRKSEPIQTEPCNIPAQEKDLPEKRVVQKDTVLQIHRVLHKLREPYKEVFSLRVFGQLSFSEISLLFGKTESWARITYHRAKKMIVEQLK